MPDLDQQDASSLERQSDDYEARFKGLQREHNKVQQTLKAQQDALTDAHGELERVRQGGGEALKAAQAQIAAISSDLNTTKAQAEANAERLKTLEAENNLFKVDKQARQKLAPKHPDLLPAYEAGFLRFDSLEDTAFQAAIDNFRSFFGKGVTPQADFSGASVPGLAVTTSPNSPNRDELFEYIMNPANMGKPDYEEKSKLYFSTIPNK